MSAVLTPELRGRFDAIRALYPPEMAASLVLPLLHCAQQAQGYVTEDDAVMIAAYIGVPAIQVLEAQRWYTMFHSAPQGRHVVKVCRNIACALRGSDTLIGHLQQRLGIAVGETTADGRFTLQTVECLASCGTAPAMQVGDTYFERLDVNRVDQILKDLP
ncbi:MAG: NAD(P)H-dependent oxidoreductase subunit E [Rubrivivax sp.]|nr:NAD(P)H-dependent oxidoreductase subunit E [Rubrivivax sp.]